MATTVARTCLNITCMLIVPVLLATNNIYIYISKVIPYGVAQRLVRGIALLLHDRGTERGWVVSSTPRPHFTSGKDPVPILQVAGWAPGPVWTGGKSRPEPSSNRYIDWATRPVCVCVYIYIYIYPNGRYILEIRTLSILFFLVLSSFLPTQCRCGRLSLILITLNDKHAHIR